MDDAIRAIPSIRGPLSISHDRREDRRRGKNFEAALTGGREEAEQAEAPEPELAPLPLAKALKGRLPVGRKDDQGRRHIDVLA